MDDHVAGLRSRSPEKRRLAARALVDLRAAARPAAGALTASLVDPTNDVRYLASRALVGIARQPGVANEIRLPPLKRAARDRDPDIRFNAVCILGEIGHERRDVVPVLVRAQRDSDQEVAGLAAWFL